MINFINKKLHDLNYFYRFFALFFNFSSLIYAFFRFFLHFMLLTFFVVFIIDMLCACDHLKTNQRLHAD